MEAIASLATCFPFFIILILICIKVCRFVKVKNKRAKFTLIQGEKKDTGPYG